MKRGLCLALVCCAAYLWAADPPKVEEKKPDAEQLVRDLGSPVFAVRDKASRDLWKLGEPARAAVVAATKSEDPEVAQRANDILEKFNWGLYPDTPADVLKQIKEFRSDDLERQTAALAALLKRDDGVKTVGLLLSHDFPAERQNELFHALLTETRDRVPLLLFQEKAAPAERILELGTAGPHPDAWLDYAVFMAQRGKLKDATAYLSKRPERSLALAVVQHFDGKSRDAIKRLSAMPKENLPREFLNSLMEDAGAWSEISGTGEADTFSAGLELFRHRIAGNTAKAADVVATLKKAATEPGDAAGEAAIALLLNERPLDGIAVLREKSVNPRLLADVLADRLQFKEVLDLLGDGPTAKVSDLEDSGISRSLYAMRKARVLAQLGRKDDSVQLFNRTAEGAPNPHSFQTREYLRAALRSGHFDLAAEYAGKALGVRTRLDIDLESASLDPMELLFDEDADAAHAWWEALRRGRGAREEPAGANMRLLRAIWTNRATPAQFETAKKAMAEWKKASALPNGSIPDRVRIYRGLAALAHRAGDLDGAEKEMRAAVREWGFDPTNKPRTAAETRTLTPNMLNPRGWMFATDETFKIWLDLGDLLIEGGKPADAATVFEQGWKQYPNNPILLYLSGRSLLASGNTKEGERRVRLSHEVALGDAQMRGRFLHELCERGELADLKVARLWTQKCVWLHTPARGNVWNQLARSSYVLQDYDGAAAAIQRNMNFLLKAPQITFIDGAGYIRVPTNVRAFRARSMLAAGKVAEAFAEAKDVLHLLPGHTEFLTGIVPDFDRQNRRKEADELFQITWGAFQKLIRENPNSAWSFASAAGAAAGCRRELDTALTYAKKAVELQPEMKWHHEAVAEVHFRRNNRPAALQVVEHLRKLDPRSPYYKRLVLRYKNDDIASPVLLSPEED